MTKEYTPAPWKIDEQIFIGFNKKKYSRIYIEAKKGRTVCSIASTDSIVDANLIAAAPDMLAALENITSRLNKLMETANLSDDDYAHYGEWVIEGNEAINKAKGAK